MDSGQSRAFFRAMAIAGVIVAPATALAHTYVMQPPPRDVAELNLNARAHKTGPCGNVPRTGPPTQYEAGATITVKFQETIDHTGCFQVAFSPANDQNFVTLKQINDNMGVQVYTTTVTLPPGVTCKECTLQVKQLMLEGATVKTCVADAAAPDGAAGFGSTYYSCADICVGSDCAEAGAPVVDSGSGSDGAASSSSSGGPTTVPTDGGGKTVPTADPNADDGTHDLHSGDGGGCSVALGATSGVSFAITFGLFGLALLRRRRQRK
jgi:hypothetical protein